MTDGESGWTDEEVEWMLEDRRRIRERRDRDRYDHERRSDHWRNITYGSYSG